MRKSVFSGWTLACFKGDLGRCLAPQLALSRGVAGAVAAKSAERGADGPQKVLEGPQKVLEDLRRPLVCATAIGADLPLTFSETRLQT